jgi:4a-hydroxytetrahydrobiopterin dehydratase
MNTEALTSKSCTPCRGGIPPLSADQVKKYHRDTPEWTILDEDRRIERTFRFNDFAEAFAFVKSVSELAEAEGHHPQISFGWGTRRSRCKPRKERACTRTTSSWQQNWISSPAQESN